MTYVDIDKAFSKGFIGGYNQIAVPAQYSTYLRNCRIENESIVMRDGFRAYTSMGNLGKYRKLKNVGGELYALIQKHNNESVSLYHLLPTNYYNTGIVYSTDDASTKDEADLIAVGDMAIVLAKGNRPQYSINGQPVQQIEDSKMVNRDGGTAIDTEFSSCMGAFYSGFVFINEIEGGKKTNRVILSHQVNMDTADWRENARNFSAQRDADGLEIPYKLVCPTTVTGIIGTMQNLYIFCEDSIQYLDQEILQLYGTDSKQLRSVPIANGYELNNHHLATAAGNFVFFFSRDKHIRSIGYTSGIYDPQIADLTDTEFGIQRWINDNIADDQAEGFAFFNKVDQTVEFHLTSKKAERYNQAERQIINDITLIRDLQHQSRLIDTGKYFGAMENFNRPRTATGQYENVPRYDDGQQPDYIEQSGVAKIVAGGTGRIGYRPTDDDLQGTFYGESHLGNFYYQTEDKYDTTFDDTDEGFINVHPIEFEYNTVNIGLTGKSMDVAEMKLFSGVRLTGAMNIHAGNGQTLYVPQEGKEITYDGKFRVTVYIDGVQQCQKTLDRHNIYDYYKRYQAEVGGPGIPDYDPNNRPNVLGYDRQFFPFDLPLDQSMVRKKGKRIRVKIECATPGADLYLSGLSIEATPLGHFDLADKY